MGNDTILTDRFDRALAFASRVHRNQSRKGTSVPYISHLLAVCAVVLEQGGTEDQAIAALLHDAPEDQGGAAMLERIRSEFGDHVGTLVAQCGEPLELKHAEWRQRKQAFLDNLERLPLEALLIVAADKVHNLECILEQHACRGDEVFNRFGGRRAGTIWYYGRLNEVLTPRLPVPLAARLAGLAAQLQALGAAEA